MGCRLRSKYCKAAFLLTLLVFVGGLVIQGQWWTCQIHQEMFPAQGLQSAKNFSNSTVKNLTKLKELKDSPSLPRSSENLVSVLDESLQQEFENLNMSLSEEMRMAKTLKVEPYNYILNEPNACLLQAPFLVLLITVEPKRRDTRDAIRKTWGNTSVAGKLRFVRLFLMGVNADTTKKGSELQHTIEDESRQYHDIVQQDYRDTYNNLTLKTMMGMYWITNFCPEATYVMKTDSDMFVNIEYLIKKILEPMGERTQRYFTGHLMKNYAPNRNKNSKWYMPPELYPGSRYPTFCSGTGYVFSGDMAQKIYAASLTIPRLHLEDVYVGICLSKLRIEPVSPPNELLFNHWRVSYSSCKYRNLITSHGFHPNELIQYWQHLQRNKHNRCW